MFTLPIINNKEFANNENSSDCRYCGGECCKRYPGAYHEDQLPELVALLPTMTPNDFHEHLVKHNLACDSRSFTIKLDEDKFVCINFYYVRPMSEYRRDTGRCVNHNYNSGCQLSFDKRPFVCKALIPNRKMIFSNDNTKVEYKEKCYLKFSDEEIELSNYVMLYSIWRKSQKELYRLHYEENYDEAMLIRGAEEYQQSHIEYIKEKYKM